jgi:hypothetical protein
MTTASAPRSSAFFALTPKSHVPRWMTAIVPARLAGKSAASQPASDALACDVGSVKSMTAIGTFANEPLPESPIVA